MTKLNLGAAERAALWMLLGGALALRLHKLDAPLWFDEVMTLVHYVRLPWSVLVADYSSFNNHLFYSLQAKLAASILGDAPWVLRLPAVIFGVASIWALWRLARTRLGAGQSFAAAALLAISYHHIWFSQNARGYTELMFWCLASLIIFQEAAGSRSWRAWAGFGAVLAAAMYTHLTAIAFIGALGLVYLLTLAMRWLGARGPEGLLAPADRRAQFAPFWGFVLGGLLTLALCAPALPQMLHQVAAVEQTSQVDVMTEYQNPIWTFIEGLRTMGGRGVLMIVAVPAAALLSLIGFAGLLRRAPVVALTGALHVAITLGALLAVNMRVWPRFFFTDIAFALLFITHGVWICATMAARLAKTVRMEALTPGRIFALGVAIMVAASALLAVRNYAAPKQDFPGAVATVGQRAGAGVGAVGLAADIYGPYLATGWRPVRNAGDLAGLDPTGGRRFAVVIFPARTSRAMPDVWAALQRDYELVRTLPGTLGDGRVLVFAEKRPRA